MQFSSLPRRLILGTACCVLLLTSCGENPKQPGGRDTTVADADSAEGLSAADRLPWFNEFDSISGAYVLRKRVENPALTAAGIAADLASLYPEIRLQVGRTSQDTLYVAIPDSRYLTQQSGSTGALDFIALATYNFTELPGIRFVTFDFEEGEHLSPGTWSRENVKPQL